MVADANDTVYSDGHVLGQRPALELCGERFRLFRRLHRPRLRPNARRRSRRHFGSDKATAATSMDSTRAGTSTSRFVHVRDQFWKRHPQLSGQGRHLRREIRLERGSRVGEVVRRDRRRRGASARRSLPTATSWSSASFSGTVDFGGGPMKSAGGSDAFMLRLDENGKTLLAARFGDSADGDAALAVAVDGSNATLLGGTAGGAIDFGGGPATPAGALRRLPREIRTRRPDDNRRRQPASSLLESRPCSSRSWVRGTSASWPARGSPTSATTSPASTSTRARSRASQRGEIPIYEPGLDELVAHEREGRAPHASRPTSPAAVRGAEVVFIAVGTPPARRRLGRSLRASSTASPRPSGENLDGLHGRRHQEHGAGRHRRPDHGASSRASRDAPVRASRRTPSS